EKVVEISFCLCCDWWSSGAHNPKTPTLLPSDNRGRERRAGAPAEPLPAISVVWVCQHVRNMHDFALKQGSSHCCATLRNNWLSSEVLHVGIGHTEFSYTFEHAVPLARDTTLISLAQPRGSLHQRIQYCFEIERRAANDPEHVGRRSLLLQRLVALADELGDIRFLAGSEVTAAAWSLWCIAARQRLAASRLCCFAACSVA